MTFLNELRFLRSAGAPG